jgi:hypothetical protein
VTPCWDVPIRARAECGPLHQMPRSIGDLVEPGLPLPLLWRDHSSDATSAEIASELSAAVPLVSSYPIRTNPWPSSARSLDGACLHQGFKDSLLVPLSCGDQEGNRLAATLRSQVYLGTEAALTAP